MNVTIRTIPHDKQRYDTVGDWQLTNRVGGLLVTVSKMDNWKHEALVGIHELVEAMLCRCSGVTEESVDAFDMAFKGDGEPGDSHEAPYHQEHMVATAVEMVVAGAMNVDWDEYCKAVADL